MNDPRVRLLIASELEADFDRHKQLLPGREVSRYRSQCRQFVIVTMAVPDAPDGAATMTPWFTTTGDHTELGGIDYYDTAGDRLT